MDSTFGSRMEALAAKHGIPSPAKSPSPLEYLSACIDAMWAELQEHEDMARENGNAVPGHGCSQTSGASAAAEKAEALRSIRSDEPGRTERKKMASGAAMTGTPLKRDEKDR